MSLSLSSSASSDDDLIIANSLRLIFGEDLSFLLSMNLIENDIKEGEKEGEGEEIFTLVRPTCAERSWEFFYFQFNRAEEKSEAILMNSLSRFSFLRKEKTRRRA